MGENLKGERGFTLIELSIVLVVIGLIVGGVLVGQNLIKAAEVRATITQVEKFNTAANTFFSKYGYLPGDIPAGPAAQFGFIARGTQRAQGDGNGVIEGWDQSSGGWGVEECGGETVTFWVDLSAAHLIDGNFSTANETVGACTATGTAVASYFPAARIGGGNYIYVYSGGKLLGSSGFVWQSTGVNYFGLSAVSSIAQFTTTSNPGMSVATAYSIDKKMDDGLPQSGKVTAKYLGVDNGSGAGGTGIMWTDGTDDIWHTQPSTAATAGSSTTCYDNGGVAGPSQYSVEISSGTNVNCGLSFQMQAGD